MLCYLLWVALATCTTFPSSPNSALLLASAEKASACPPRGDTPAFKLVPASNYRNYVVDSARLAKEIAAKAGGKPKRLEFLVQRGAKCSHHDGYTAITTVEMCMRAARSIRAYSESTCADAGPMYCGRNASAVPKPCRQCTTAYLNPTNCLSRDGTCNGLEAVGQCKLACEEFYDANDWAPFSTEGWYYNAWTRTYSSTTKCTRKSIGWLKKEEWRTAWPRCRVSERDICLASCPKWEELNASWTGVDNVTVCGNATEPEVELTHEKQDTHAYPHDDVWPYGCYILEGKDPDSPAELKFNPNKQSAGDCTDSGDVFGSARCLCARSDVAAGLDKLPPKKTTLYDGAPYPEIRCFGNGWCGETIFHGGAGRMGHFSGLAAAVVMVLGVLLV